MLQGILPVYVTQTGIYYTHDIFHENSFGKTLLCLSKNILNIFTSTLKSWREIEKKNAEKWFSDPQKINENSRVFVNLNFH